MISKPILHIRIQWDHVNCHIGSFLAYWLCVVQIWRRTPPSPGHFTFFNIFCEIRPKGISQPYRISLSRRWNPRMSKEGSEIPRGPEGGMYDAKFERHIIHISKNFVFRKFFGNLWNRSIIEKKGVLKDWIFGAVFEKVFAKLWRIMRFWYFFWIDQNLV